MRRHASLALAILAPGLAVSLTLAARADDAKPGGKFDLKKRVLPKQGDKTVDEKETEFKKTIVMTIDEKPKAQINDDSKSYRAIREAVAVAGDTVKNEKIKFERWKHAVDKREDTSLVGKTVVIPGEGDSPDFTIEGEQAGPAPPAPLPDDVTAATPTSKNAKAWIKEEFLKTRLSAEVDALVPGEPVAQNAEWNPDAKAVAGAFFPDWEFDAAKSTATGKLASVSTEDGVRIAHIEVNLRLQLAKVPGSQLGFKDDGNKDNGVIRLTGTVDCSLDPEKKVSFAAKFDEEVDLTFDMKQGDKTIAMEMNIKGTIKASEARAK